MRTYEPDGVVLSAFLQDRSRVAIIQGPIGSGTSSGSMMRLFMHLCEQRPNVHDGVRRSRWAVVRNTYPELEETTIKTWLDWFPEDEFGVMKVTRPPTHHVRFADVEAEIVFLALDSPDDVRKLRSSEWTGFLFNELQYIPKEILDEADSRVGRYPSMKDGGSEWVGLLADMNAPEPGHFVLYMRGDEAFPEWMTPEERLEFDVPDTWRFFVQPPAVLEKRVGGQVVGYEVNRGQGDFPPAENMKWLDPQYYENMLVGKSRAFIRTRMMNVTDFFVDGQPVWKDFREELHVSREPLEPFEGLPILVGLDFGRQPAFVAAQVVRDRVRILSEGQASDSSAVKFAPVVKAELAKRFPGRDDFEFWGDPSADRLHEVNEHSAFQIFQAHGMRVMPAPGNNAFRPRVEAVEQQLTRIVDGQPCWLVDPRCRALIGAMRGGYYYPRIKGTTRVHADPAKNPSSHVAEAAQYLALGAGLGRTLVGAEKRKGKVNTKTRRQPVFKRRVA